MIGPEIAGHPVWNIRCKAPINPLATVPWHQDTAYLVEGSEHTLQPTAWIPLLDAQGENGTLQVERGGHRTGSVLPHHQVQWPEWTKRSRTEIVSLEEKTDNDKSACVDVVVDGPWLKRWTD